MNRKPPAEQLHESIAGAIIHMIGVPIFIRTLKKAAKQLDTPEIDAQIADLGRQLDMLVDNIRNLCKRNPNHKDCTKKEQERLLGKRTYDRVKHRLK
jgi:hypothetical protein